MKKYILLLCVLIAILVSSCADNPEPNKIKNEPELDDPVEECSRVGGEWKIFSTTCAATCETMERIKKSPDGQIACGTALTSSCDCGPNRCWDGFTCQDV